MDPKRWRQVRALFERAVAEPDPESRRALLEAEAASDPELVEEVQDLLSADEQQHSLLDGPHAATTEALAPGTPVGEFVVERCLGAGGFGAVYQVHHPVIGKRAAAKVLHRARSANPEHAARFITEARAAAALGHPGIVDVFGFGALPDGRRYALMELVEGQPLSALLAERERLPIEEAAPLLLDVARALEAAHAQGIVHRDLKPDNVMVLSGPPASAKLLDFGVAKLLGEGEQSHRTATGVLVGTPAYMSPEQARGAPVGPATDVYSFGVMAYKLVTGRLPFLGSSVVEMLMHHVQTPPTPPSALVPVSPAAEQVILQMLDKDPARRPTDLVAAVRAMRPDGEATVAGPLVGEARAGQPSGPPDRRATPRTAAVRGEPADLPAVTAPARAATTPGTAASPTLDGRRLGAAASDEPVSPRPVELEATPAGPGGARRPLAWALAVTGAGLLAALGYAALGAAVPAPTAPTAPPPVAATNDTPSAPALAPAQVRLQLDGAPVGALVRGPSGVVGRLPLQVDLPRQDAPLVLRVSAPGHLTRTLEVRPDRDRALEVTLAPEPAPLHPDLEAPWR
ncbi:MAG: protein kinase [Deltaproteobacteria bacterium]|nr:protein kinase [Deltaproteobacteria bacterium]